MILYEKYTTNFDHMKLEGFCVGWSSPMDEQTHRNVLKQSYVSFVAIDTSENKIIGFINVISDGVLAAYIPLLEVLPSYQGQGIGAELVRRVLDELKDLYMVDLCCDQELQPFYEKFGMKRSFGMVYRNYNKTM